MIKLSRPICPKPLALDRKDYKDPINKQALSESSNGKCMYCESKINHIDHAHVEHIKPKAAHLYPELEFSWDNLGFACPKCNGNKADKYDPNYPYLNPYSEDPEDHIVYYGWVIVHKLGSQRGQLTIIDLELNRIDLVEKRKEKIERITQAIDACYRTSNITLRDAALSQLKLEYLPDREYSLAVKFIINAHYQK